MPAIASNFVRARSARRRQNDGSGAGGAVSTLDPQPNVTEPLDGDIAVLRANRTLVVVVSDIRGQ